MKKCFTILILLSLLSLNNCDQSVSPSDNPGWVNELIEKYKSEPVGNPPQSIWSYTYNGQTVYYVPPQCCDQFSSLFDKNGILICAPDGGFFPGGDGRCPDFFQNRKDEKVIWKDPRQD